MQTQTDQGVVLPNRQAKAARVFGLSLLVSLGYGAVGICMLIAHYGKPFDNQSLFHIAVAGLVVGGLGVACSLGFFAVLGEARRIEQCRQAMGEGKYLVRWRYSRDTWVQWRQSTSGGEDNKWWIVVGLVGGIGVLALIVALLQWVLPASHPKQDSSTPHVLGFVLLVVSAICALSVTLFVVINASYRRLMQTPQDTYVSTLGVYANGKWIVWGNAFQRLMNVEVLPATEDSPTTLQFSVNNANNTVPQSILVPDGQQALAERVAQAILAAPEATQGGKALEVFSIYNFLRIVLRLFE